MSSAASRSATSPFSALSKHTEKVHACVELVRPLVDALLRGDFDRIAKLHDDVSRAEYIADQVKMEVREMLSAGLASVNSDNLSRYLGYQDDVADAAEDFAVVLSIRKTRIHPALEKDFRAFAEQVIKTSETMLAMAHDLVSVAAEGFAGEKAQAVMDGTRRLGEEEWKADRLQRAFARRSYELEDQLDPVTLLFYDKICATLSAIANKAENTGKFLHMLIAHG